MDMSMSIHQAAAAAAAAAASAAAAAATALARPALLRSYSYNIITNMYATAGRQLASPKWCLFFLRATALSINSPPRLPSLSLK